VGAESPNGQLDADVEISVLSHEMNEAVTDPIGTAWVDSTGGEIGDDCAYIYGGGFGGAPGTLFNQTINGTHYFVQEEFSNQDYKRRHAGCVQLDELPTVTLKVKPGAPSVGKPATFTAKATDKDGSITAYSWNFGDHSSLGSGATVTHSYAGSGPFTVTVTVTDIDGWQGTASKNLTVH